ncbi:MAG: serine/threonine-protein kinase [Lachnospiraceae bacterium]|nr:serine/threonine-protein kinase [Lachnospiraceae bacterium]
MSKYEFVREIGTGNFSKVDLVRNRENGMLYACKESENTALLKKEAQIYERISHPTFAKFIEYFEEDEKGFLILEYVPGTDLYMVTDKRESLNFGVAVRIALEVAEGIRYLNTLNPPVIYRDLKPENIMVCENGHVKIVDLGSCIWDADDGSKSGSRSFSAPEVFIDREEPTAAGDVYSLAKLLYYMLSGSTDESMCMYLQGGSKGVSRLLLDCLVRDPKKRVPSADMFIKRLSPYLGAEGMRFLLAELKSKKYGKKHSLEEYTSYVAIYGDN